MMIWIIDIALKYVHVNILMDIIIPRENINGENKFGSNIMICQCSKPGSTRNNTKKCKITKIASGIKVNLHKQIIYT